MVLKKLQNFSWFLVSVGPDEYLNLIEVMRCFFINEAVQLLHEVYNRLMIDGIADVAQEHTHRLSFGIKPRE